MGIGDIIGTVVIGIVIIFGLVVFYWALKEPMDYFLGKIWVGLSWIGNKMLEGGSATGEVIHYD